MTASTGPHPQRQRTHILAGVVAMLLLLLAVGLAVWRVTARSANKPVNLSALYWVVYKEDVIRMNAADPAIVRKLAAGPGSYAFEQSAGGTPMPSGFIPVQLFFSNASLQTAIDNNALLSGVQWAADDPEAWSRTPVAEQQDPVPYMQKFSQAAQGKGRKVLLVPGRDLMQVPGAVCGQKQGQTISQAYVACGLPKTAAYASVYVIQAAPVELDQTALVQLVQQAAAQARAANPNVVVIATLSTTPNGSPVGYTAINQAARKILPYVQGFELNSTAATDSRMIAFLHALESGS